MNVHIFGLLEDNNRIMVGAHSRFKACIYQTLRRPHQSNWSLVQFNFTGPWHVAVAKKLRMRKTEIRTAAQSLQSWNAAVFMEVFIFSENSSNSGFTVRSSVTVFREAYACLALLSYLSPFFHEPLPGKKEGHGQKTGPLLSIFIGNNSWFFSKLNRPIGHHQIKSIGWILRATKLLHLSGLALQLQ